MSRFIAKAGRAIEQLVSNPRHFFKKLKPYLLRAESGLIEMNGVRFRVELDLDPAMRKMYFGSYQVELTSLLERYLGEGDTFIDIGANVGYVSAVALGLVGKTGNVHAFEPVPQYLARVCKLQEDNPDFNLHVHGKAVGEHEGTATIAVSDVDNMGWNTMVPGFMSEEIIREQLEIDVIRLTDYLSGRDVQNLRLVKIDTEGFEFPVMKGFRDFLLSLQELPVLIIEIAPSAYSRLNSTCAEFAEFMQQLGYVARRTDCVRPVQIGNLEKTTDVVFLPKTGIHQIRRVAG